MQIAQNDSCLLELKFSFECVATRMLIVMCNVGLDTVP